MVAAIRKKTASTPIDTGTSSSPPQKSDSTSAPVITLRRDRLFLFPKAEAIHGCNSTLSMLEKANSAPATEAENPSFCKNTRV